jgi:ElaB/YqjD/DUF883 family membrane-anchored ribosome-binding protein
MGEEAALTGSGNRKSPEEIRAEIEQTRAELSETVNVLRERLSPGHLKRQMVEKLRNSTVGRARKMMETSTERAKELGSIVAETAQRNPVTKTILDNPIPAVLAGIGIGAAWLIWRKTGKSSGRAKARADTGSETEAGELCSCMGMRPEESAGTVAGKAKQMVGQGRERAQEAVGQAREKAGQVFEQAKEKAGQLGTATREKARALKERSRGLTQEKPLLLAAAALGAGAILGFTLPAPERERQWLARMKDRLLSRTREFSEEKYGEAAHIAGDRPWSSGVQGSGDLNL